MNSGPTAYRFLAAPQSEYHTFLWRTSPRPFAFLLGKRGDGCAPQRGVFCSSWKRGDVCAPHFFFSRERKRNVPRPVQRKRALGAAFVTKAAPFSFVLYVLKTGALVLCGLVLPLAPLTLTSAGRVRFLLFGTGSICFQILQQHELNIICNRPVFLRCQFPDFIQHVLR